MADWFVCQYDVFANDLDPDALGVMLTPVYDANHNIIYTENDQTGTSCIRRVKSIWRVDLDIKQYDFVIQSSMHASRQGLRLPPLHASTSSTTQYAHWFPTHNQLQFSNTTNGFSVENKTIHQCLVVVRDASTLQNQAKLMHPDLHGEYTVFAGLVVGIRIHKLSLIHI